VIRRAIIAREHNVVHVDFRRQPDLPTPKFPGAAALHKAARQLVNAVTIRLKAEAA
jgi:hypothetical protein